MGKRSRKNRFRTAGANALAEAPSVQAALIPASPTNGGQSSAAADFDPGLEYVAGFGLAYSALERQIPAQPHDPKPPEVTFETYRQMLNDPEVCSDVRTLAQMALAEVCSSTHFGFGLAAPVSRSSSTKCALSRARQDSVRRII